MPAYIETSYSGGPEESFVNDFADTIELALQQKEAKLWSTTDSDNYTGDKGFWDRIEAFDANEKTSRNETANTQSAEYSRRIMNWRTPYVRVQIDIEDIKRMGKDPTNANMASMVAALNRQKDQYVVDSYFSDVLVRQNDADVTVSFPSAQQIAVDYTRAGGGSASNLNPEKMLRAREILDTNYTLDDGGITYIVMHPSQYYAMCTHADVKTIDTFNSKPIVDATIKGVAGFRFIMSTLLGTDGSGFRRVAAYTEKAIRSTMKEELFVRYWENPEKHYQPELYIRCMCNAKRQWEEAIVEIKCDETKAA